MDQAESNLNYGKIALITGDYFVNNFDEKRSVKGRLIFIENDVKLFFCNSAKRWKQVEQYRFRHCEKNDSYTISGFCLTADVEIIDENNLEQSLKDAWIEGMHRKTGWQKVKYSFKPTPDVPLKRLMEDYGVINDARNSTIVLDSQLK
ncbi:MAG: hypothetical protein ACP5N3_03840 [Candidatus Nanoarchaeia archaeon]